MKNKKIIIYILTIILSLTIITCSGYISYVKADSGWDTDYDSGSGGKGGGCVCIS